MALTTDLRCAYRPYPSAFDAARKLPNREDLSAVGFARHTYLKAEIEGVSRQKEFPASCRPPEGRLPQRVPSRDGLPLPLDRRVAPLRRERPPPICVDHAVRTTKNLSLPRSPSRDGSALPRAVRMR